MSYIPDCRTDEYYNEKYLEGLEKTFIEGFDFCVEYAVESGFDNIDEWTLRDEVDVRPSDIMKVVEAVKEWISDFIESRRDELITSIIDDMGEEEYVKVKSKVDGKPFSYEDSHTE